MNDKMVGFSAEYVLWYLMISSATFARVSSEDTLSSGPELRVQLIFGRDQEYERK